MMSVDDADHLSVHHGHRQVLVSPPGGCCEVELSLTGCHDTLRRWRSSSSVRSWPASRATSIGRRSCWRSAPPTRPSSHSSPRQPGCRRALQPECIASTLMGLLYCSELQALGCVAHCHMTPADSPQMAGCLRMLMLRSPSSCGGVAQDVHRSRSEAKERRVGEWVAACDAVRQARTDAAATAAAAEQDMAIARSQQQYNRARDRLTAAQAEQQRAAAMKVGGASMNCSSALANLLKSLEMLASS